MLRLVAESEGCRGRRLRAGVRRQRGMCGGVQGASGVTRADIELGQKIPSTLKIKGLLWTEENNAFNVFNAKNGWG